MAKEANDPLKLGEVQVHITLIDEIKDKDVLDISGRGPPPTEKPKEIVQEQPRPTAEPRKQRRLGEPIVSKEVSRGPLDIYKPEKEDITKTIKEGDPAAIMAAQRVVPYRRGQPGSSEMSEFVRKYSEAEKSREEGKTDFSDIISAFLDKAGDRLIDQWIKRMDENLQKIGKMRKEIETRRMTKVEETPSKEIARTISAVIPPHITKPKPITEEKIPSTDERQQVVKRIREIMTTGKQKPMQRVVHYTEAEERKKTEETFPIVMTKGAAIADIPPTARIGEDPTVRVPRGRAAGGRMERRVVDIGDPRTTLEDLKKILRVLEDVKRTVEKTDKSIDDASRSQASPTEDSEFLKSFADAENQEW